MKVSLLRTLALGAALTVLPSFAAHAATQGTLGSTSTGSVVINATIPNLVKLSKLNNIPLGTFTGTALAGSTTACVFSNTGNYGVTATSTNPGTGNTFRMTDGTNFIPYTISWNDGGGADVLASSVALTTQSGTSTDVDCSGGTNTTVSVALSAAQIGAAPAGNFTDTVTIVVVPE
jgi:spore coat protein U-like protein